MKELIPREHINEIRKLLAEGESLKEWRERVEQEEFLTQSPTLGTPTASFQG